MPSTRQLRRPSIGMQNSRRTRGTRSSFQGLIAVCIGVAFTITILRILQDPHLPSGQHMPSPKTLRGDGTSAAAVPAQPASGGGRQQPAGQQRPIGAGDGHDGSSGSITPSREVGFIEVKAGLGGGGDHETPLPVEVVGVGAGEGEGGGGGGGGDGQAAVDNLDKFLTVPSEDDDLENHSSSSGGGGGGGGGGGSKAGEEGSGGQKQQPAGEPINSYNGEVVSGGGGERNGEATGQQQGAPAVGVAAEAKDPVAAAAAGALVPAPEGGGAAPAGAGVLANLDPDNVRREERRDRLNRLVEEAVAGQRGRECNVAFIKTHKTASTTLTAVLYRYGLRHARRVARFQVEGTAVTLEHAARETQESGNRVEIFHYHHVWNGYYEASWDKARALFNDIMVQPSAGNAGSDVVGSGTKYVTVLREPKAHWLSYFYFYYQPEMNMGVEEYFKSGKSKIRPLKDPLAAEFGIYNDRDLDEFILNYLPTFALTMLTEELDEGLVLLGRIMGWDPIDLTYASLLEARDGATRWDDKPITKAPRPKDLHSSTLAELERVTSLDSRLYEAAKEAYEKVKELHSEGFEEEVAQLRELQSDVLAILNEGVGRAGKVSPARAWYMPESDYYFYSADKSRWWEEYYPAALPF